MLKIKYDEQGGILPGSEKQKTGQISKNGAKSAYSFFERLAIRLSPGINYLLDQDGRFRSRRQKAPRVLRIGPTNRCSGACFYCPREYIHDKGSGYMDFGLYEKIIARAKEAGTDTVSFALFGEPLLHPRFFDMLGLAVKKGFRMRISTNAIVMDKAKADRLLEYPFDSIEISMDGYTREEYLKGKQVDQYERAKENVAYLLGQAKEKKSQIVFNIHFVDIGQISLKNKINYIRYWKRQLKGLKYATSFYYEPHNWAGTRAYLDKDQSFLSRFLNHWELKRPCIFIKGMNINWNGDVYVCANDPTPDAVLGNVAATDLIEVYNNEKRMGYLSAHEKGDFAGLNCAACSVNSIRPLAYLKKRILAWVVGVFS